MGAAFPNRITITGRSEDGRRLVVVRGGLLGPWLITPSEYGLLTEQLVMGCAGRLGEKGCR